MLAAKRRESVDIHVALWQIWSDFHLEPRSKAMRALFGEGIFTQDGLAWEHSREVLRRQFVRMQYKNLEGFQEHVENLISRLHNYSTAVVDLQPLFYRLTLSTTIAMILGQPVESFKHDVGDHFSNSLDKASLITANRVRLGVLYTQWIFRCMPNSQVLYFRFRERSSRPGETGCIRERQIVIYQQSLQRKSRSASCA